MKKMTVALLAGLLSASAFADQGDILARFRVIDVAPSVSTTGTLSTPASAGGLGAIAVGSNTVPELDFTYMLTNNVGAELILGTSRHSVTAANGAVNLGKVSVLPPTLTLQYHFTPQNAFRPYIGAGLNYTYFYSNGLKDGTTPVNVKSSSFGPAFQIGADYAITKDWFVNVDVKKLFISTEVSAGGSSLGTLTINPWVYGVGIGTKF